MVNVTQQGLQPGDRHTGSRETRQWVGFMLEAHISTSEVNEKQVKKDSVVTLDRCCLGAAEIRRDEERVREVIQHKELPNKQ